uniref:myelin-associated glycoprotein-like n=1 Tax=Pristiophorus japonicus TaxID=55135 RepID=UPI00398F7947
MEVLRLMPIFLNLLPGALSEGWTIRALPRRAVSRSCVVIPCTFDFPSHRYKALHGAWFKYWHYWKYTVVYTKDPKYGMSTFVGRAKIIGDLEQKNCTLRINNLRPDDSDVYYFYVDLEGFTDHTFTEPVQLQVVHVPDKPEILLHEDITEGNPVNIICKSLFACPDNRPILTWSELPESTVNTVTKNSDEVSTVLTFNPSFKHHGLTVLCTADFPETSHRLVNSVTLSVKYSPRNTLVRMTFTDGNLISLHCSSEGNPAIHRFSWSKLSNGKGTDLSKVGETITVPKGIGEESYSCTATNTLGSSQSPPVRIPTEYAPRNLSIISRDTIKDSSITITEGNSAVILCSVQSIPASNLMWRHRGVTMNRTRSNNELWLEFLHVTSRVAGDYQCVAENEHGAVEGSMTIAVEHKYPHRERTVAISGATGGVREGSNVTLTCSSESFPPASSYAWFRIDGNTSVQLNTRARSVHFSHVTRGDDASFYCTARNPLDIGRSTIVHLSVEYKPEISWESECIRRAEGITCVCVARSNPPGDLTWNLPLANISGNQSSGHFVAWRVSKGQRVTGSLTLRGGQGEEGATVVCLVRNRHGEAMFKVYLWVKGGACNEWKVGLLVAGIMLSVALVGFVIFKTKAAATERASKPNDIAMTYSHLSAKHQGEQNTVVVDAWNISSDASSEAQTPTPQDLPKGRAGGEAAREQPAKHENLLYANINLLKLPSGDGTVHGGKGTDCILCN